MKKILTLAIIFLLIISMFPIILPKVEAFSYPNLVEVGISYEQYSTPITPPITQTPGGHMRLWYHTYNPNSYSVNVILGASIKIGSTYYSDPSHDKVVTLSPGHGNPNRYFYVPYGVPSGSYTVIFAIWDTDWNPQYDSETSSGWINMVSSVSVQLSSSPSNLGSITWDGVTYSLPKTVYTTTRIHWSGTDNIHCTPPVGYEFDHWESSGNVDPRDDYSQWTSVDVDGSGSLKAVFKAIPNIPPTLSGGYVTPTTGDTSKLFYYYVHYYDPEGAAPTQRQVCIDGTHWHTMGLYSGSVSNGWYRCILTLSAGGHNYYFKFSDGVNMVYLPSSGTYSGPTVFEPTLDGEIAGYVVLTPEVVAGNKLQVQVTVKNIGDIRAEYNVYIGNIWDSNGNNAGNAYSESHRIIQLDPRKSQTLTLEWTTPTTMSPSAYTADLHLQMAKPGGGWEKQKKYPNAISFTVASANHAPNLSGGYVDPNPGYPDTNFKFLVKYTDQDGDPAVVKKFYVYDGGWLSYDMDHLAGNPTIGEWFIVWGTGFSLGSHNFYFYFTDGDLSDREPTSGYYSFSLVEHPKPDLIISDITWTPSSPLGGDTMTFAVYIKNQGTADTSSWGSFDVTYYIDGDEMGSWTISNLAVGDTVSKQFTWTATRGTHTVKAYADHGGFIPEIDDGNNEKQKSFTVEMGTITVSGRFVFLEEDGTTERDVRYARVQLCDSDLGGAVIWVLAETETQTDGSYLFPPIVNNDGFLEDGYDIFVRIYTDSFAVVVTSNSWPTYPIYEDQTPQRDNVADGPIDMGKRIITNNRGAWAIYDTIILGWQYATTLMHFHPKVTIRWPRSGTSGTASDVLIYIRDTAAFQEDVILHEYGHAIQYNVYGGRIPDSIGDHSWDVPTNRNFAFSEGWATFFGVSSANEKGYGDSLFPKDSWYRGLANHNLETDTAAVGDDVEGAIACILWDIYDSSDDGRDILSAGMSPIWDVFSNYVTSSHHPYTIHEFWEGWIARGHDDEQQMWGIYYDHGINIDTTAPDVEILSPSDGAIMTTSTIEVTWTGSDDASGMDHYEIRLDSGSWVNIGLVTSYTFSGVTEGFHIVEVKAVDGAELENTDSHSFSVILLDGEIVDYVVLTPIVMAGEKLQVEVTVENIGVLRAEYNIYIGNIWDSEGTNAGNAYSESHRIIQLDPGGSQTLTLEWTTPDTMLPGDSSGDLHLQMARPSSGWEKHKEYPDAISFTVFLEFLVSLGSRTTAGETNIGSIDFDCQKYDLPNTIFKEEGIYEATANLPDGYHFDSWEYSGSISVSSSTSQTTSVTVWGECSLKAVFKGTLIALSVSATIVEPLVLRETVGLRLTVRNTGTAQLDEGSYIVTVSFWDYPEEGGIDSFGVRYIHHHAIQLGPPQSIAIEVPALAPGQEYTQPQTLRFPVLDHQQPTLILADTMDVLVEGYGVTASTQIKNVNVLPGLETYCNAILAIVTELIPIKDEEVKLALDLGLPVLEAQIENAMEELSNAIAAANEGDVAEMANHLAKMGVYMTLWTTLLSPEEQLDFLVDIAWAFLDGPFSIANLLIFWVNFKHETYLAGFDLLSLSFIQAIGRNLGLSFITDPTNILVIDPLGRRCGFDYKDGLIINEIPDAYIYGLNGDVEAVFISEPIEGEYEIYFAGLTDGSFGLHIEGANGTSLVCDIVYSGIISEGEILDSDVIVIQTDRGLEITTSVPTPLGQAYTDKEEYEVGEAVLLSFQNIGEIPITLTNTAPWVILDEFRNVVYRALGAMTPVDVNPGESKEWQWNQKDDFGNQVFPGIYLFRIYTSDGNYTAWFSIVDTIPPTIQIISPQNTTYAANDVDLIFTIDESASWIGYSLDGQENVTIAGNTVLTGLEEGSHNIMVFANDTYGNTGFSSLIYFTIDTNPPTTGISLSGTLGLDEWYLSDVTVTLTATDDVSGVAARAYSFDGITWITYSGPFTVSSEGIATVYYNSTDNAGNIEDTKSTTVKIDKTTPITTIDLTGTLGNDGWYLSDVTVTLGASDATSGILQIKYSFDDTTWIVYTTPFIIDTEGTTIVYVRSTDNAGNVETGTFAVKIDKTPPDLFKSLSGTLGNNDWYVSDVTVTLSGTDAVSGLASIEYSFDGTMWYTYSTPFLIDNEGTTDLYHKAYDIAGNEFVLPSQQIQIDKTLPVTTISLSGNFNNGWYTSDVTITLDAFDATSGLENIYYKVDNGVEQIYLTQFLVSGEGPHTIEFWSVDNAGNVETYNTDTLQIDTTAPITTASLSGTLGLNDWYITSVQVTLIAEDPGESSIPPTGSGVHKTYYILDGGTQTEYTGPFAVSGQESHTVQFWSVDIAGNTEAANTVGFKIDTIAPVTTASQSPDGNNGWWKTSPASVTLSASDTTSRVMEIHYQVDSGTYMVVPEGSTLVTVEGNGIHTVNYYAVDYAGNQEAEKTETVKIDTTSPTTTLDIGAPQFTIGPDVYVTSTTSFILSPSDNPEGSAPSLDALNSGYAIIVWPYEDNLVYVEEAVMVRACTTKPPYPEATKVLFRWIQPNGSCYDVGPKYLALSGDTWDGLDIYDAYDARTLDLLGDWGVQALFLDEEDNLCMQTIERIRVVSFLHDRSGIATTYYRVYPIGTLPPPFDHGITFQITGSDGEYTIEYYSTDTAGNEEPLNSETVILDNTPPTTTETVGIPLFDSFVTSATQFSLDALDSGAGLQGIYYRINSGSWVLYSGPFTLSGPDGICTIEFYSVDELGNTETIDAQTYTLDNMPPSSSDSLSGTLGDNNWFVSTVTVTLLSDDLTGSGVATILYNLNGGDVVTYSSPFEVTVEGRHSIEFWSVDNLGNAESPHRTDNFKIDTTDPLTSVSLDPPTPDGLNEWYISDITVALTAIDDTSGIAKAEYSFDDATWIPYAGPIVIGTEGTTTIWYKSTDTAGNAEAVKYVSMNLDKTSPVISGDPTTSSNAYGWYNTDVVVHFDATDALSGLDIVTPDQTLSVEAADQSVTGTAMDKAGNTAFYTVSGINIDKTPPTIMGTPMTPANVYGWYKIDVTVHFTATDSLSGIDSVTPDIVLSSEGEGQSVTGTAIDLAGNEASCTVSEINIDTTPPIITGTPTTSANAYGWYNTDVTVHFTASDSLSGIDTVTPDQTLTGEGADQSVTGLAVDKAGNSASYVVSGINIDKTDPTTSLTIGEPKFGADPTYVTTTTDFTLEASDTISDVDHIEYKIDSGAWTTYSTQFNVLDFDSHTLYYRSVDIAGNIEDIQSIWIVVNAASISYSGDTNGQYSDAVTVNAILIDMATQQSIEGKTIFFTIGSQTVSATTDSSGVATASIVLDQPEGTYTVSATFSGDTDYFGCSTTQSFTIHKENAELEYTGDTVVPTTANSINLRATIFDSPDGYWGDLTRIQVTFSIYAGLLGSTPFMTIPAVPVSQTDMPGVGVAAATIDILPENGYLIIVSIDSNEYYEGPTSDATPLTVYEPTGDFVTGGGWIRDPSGSKGNFGFNVKYTRSGKPQGHATYVYRESGWDIIVKSNAWIGLAIDGKHAYFEAKCVVQKYNPATGELVWAEGNYKFRIDVWDNDSDGGVDTYQIRAMDKNGVLFHEAGSDPFGYLQGGNIVIHDERRKKP